MDQPLYYIVSFLGAVQGILLSLVFFFRNAKHPAALALGLFLLIFSLGLFERYVQNNFDGTAGWVLLSFLGFSNFLYGPLLYLFVHFLTSKDPCFRFSQVWHFVPFVLGFSLSLVSPLFEVEPDTTGVQEVILFELLVIQLLSYNILAITKLHRFHHTIDQFYSSFHYRDMRWLKAWLYLITFAYVVSIAITHALVFGWEQGRQFYIVVQVLITVSIYLMSYRLILYPGLFSFAVAADQEEQGSHGNGKYQKSGLKPEMAARYTQQLLDFMTGQKPYLDPDLNILQLSEVLGISRNHLTEILNKSLSKNFYELVNEYRVEEVKRLMRDPAHAHLTLSAIGFEAGFKSKSAFNMNFKAITGLTPSQWKKKEEGLGDFAIKEVST